MTFNERFLYQITSLPAMDGQRISSKELGKIPLRAIGYEYYTIDFSARNGQWRQICEVYRMPGARDIFSTIIYKKLINNNKEETVILFKDLKRPESMLNDIMMELDVQIPQN